MLYECYVGQRSSLNSVLGYLHLSIFVVVVGDDLIWIGFTDQTKSRFCDMLLLAMELAALTGYLGVYFPIPTPSTTWVLESKLKSSYLADAFPRKPSSPPMNLDSLMWCFKGLCTTVLFSKALIFLQWMCIRLLSEEASIAVKVSSCFWSFENFIRLRITKRDFCSRPPSFNMN